MFINIQKSTAALVAFAFVMISLSAVTTVPVSSEFAAVALPAIA